MSQTTSVQIEKDHKCPEQWRKTDPTRIYCYVISEHWGNEKVLKAEREGEGEGWREGESNVQNTRIQNSFRLLSTTAKAHWKTME